MKTIAFLLLGILLCLGASGQVIATKPADPLLGGFIHPPQSARPLVWWHWMNGNISKEGIKLDLEWMHRVGVAGFQNSGHASTKARMYLRLRGESPCISGKARCRSSASLSMMRVPQPSCHLA
jgi:alpha-L-rhamnosidase